MKPVAENRRKKDKDSHKTTGINRGGNQRNIRSRCVGSKQTKAHETRHN